MITINRKTKKSVVINQPVPQEHEYEDDIDFDIPDERKLAIAKDVIYRTIGSEKAKEIYVIVEALPTVQARIETYKIVLEGMMGAINFRERTSHYFDYRITPVSPEQFLLDDYYLGLQGSVYDVVLENYCALNTGDYVEAVLTGSIGCAKTTIAIWTTAYQLYLISCFRNPQRMFNLDKSSEIIFIFQSLNANLAKAVDYSRFKSLIEKSRYFSDNFPPDKGILSELRFPNNIIVKPISGSESGAIGQNVIGGVIDELNFMAYVENSKASRDGDVYDQAIALYNSISRRRKSRFMLQGKLPGRLCLVSSKRYPGQFTDTKMDEAAKEVAETGKTTIFVYDKTTWDIMPADRFSGKWFTLYIGDDNHKPQILESDADVMPYMTGKLMQVPEEYKVEFQNDIQGSLRDIAGVTTLATHPFFTDIEPIVRSFDPTMESVLSRDLVDFYRTKLEIYPELFRDLDQPRWCHIDLGVTGDYAGIVVGYCSGFKVIDRGDYTETLPNIKIDLSLAVAPPKNGEINFAKIRALIYKLRDNGLYIKWVTLDSFQSVDMKQLLSHKGYLTGNISTDTSLMPYSLLKSAFADDRIQQPMNERLKTELVSLEFIPKKGKVDHPPQGSKDISDALASVVYGLTTRKETWVRWGVPLTEIPEKLTEAVRDESHKDAKAERQRALLHRIKIENDKKNKPR